MVVGYHRIIFNITSPNNIQHYWDVELGPGVAVVLVAELAAVVELAVDLDAAIKTITSATSGAGSVTLHFQHYGMDIPGELLEKARAF